MEKVKLTRELRVLALAVLAGMAIGIGGVLYLTLENKVVGALMFTVGLYAICAHGLNLFTGKVGYLVNKPVSYLITLLEIWVGNLCGTYLAADGYREVKNPVILFMGVAAFILCGFEHCIADMFYFSAAGMWSGGAFLRIIIITLGNSLGGILIPLVKKLPAD